MTFYLGPSKLPPEGIHVFARLYRGLAKILIKDGLREFQAILDLIPDPENVDPKAFLRCTVAFCMRPRRRPYVRTAFGLISRN